MRCNAFPIGFTSLAKLERWFWELSDGNINPKKSAVPGRKFMCMCDFFVAH